MSKAVQQTITMKSHHENNEMRLGMPILIIDF